MLPTVGTKTHLLGITPSLHLVVEPVLKNTQQACHISMVLPPWSRRTNTALPPS